MTKQFFPTYLYIKTHNITGLKYFGKTTQDPFSYRGSGKYWLRHISYYGNNVTTEIIGYFTNKDECKTAALNFSLENNIVDSHEWANLIEENGLDGGATTWGPRSEETKQKISEAQKGKIVSEETKEKIRQKRKNQDMSHMKKPKSEEMKNKISKSLTGRTQSEETKRKRSEKLKGRARPKEVRQKISEGQKGKKISPEAIEKMKETKRNNPLSDKQRQRLSEMYSGRIWTEEEKEKIRGQIVVVDRQGNLVKISVVDYKEQLGDDCEYVHFRTAEGKRRRASKMPTM